MKLLIVLFLLSFFSLVSCENKSITKINMNQAIDDELNQISFQEVDIYPHFSNCKTDEDAQATKHCFVETLHL